MQLLSLALTALSASFSPDTSVTSPAQDRIAQARTELSRNPENVGALARLAFALTRRARETANADDYARALEVVAQALELRADDFEALKIRAWALLGQHEFQLALELARSLRERVPDDLFVYGLLVDANVELGHYEAAEEAAQWLLDLRPGNVTGLTRAAYLRELFGDADGALTLFSQAFHAIAPHEIEDRAWILVQMAHLALETGDLEHADAMSRAALELFPDYHYGLALRARVERARGEHEQALALSQRHFEAAPHPENLFEVGVALEELGRSEEARGCFDEFERAALAESKSWDNANLELIFYYTDFAAGQDAPAQALRIAESQAAKRRDVRTLHALAWAQSANGHQAQALESIESALAVGIHDARIAYHAGVIARRAGETKRALRHFKSSIDWNPRSQNAAAAEAAVRELGA